MHVGKQFSIAIHTADYLISNSSECMPIMFHMHSNGKLNTTSYLAPTNIDSTAMNRTPLVHEFNPLTIISLHTYIHCHRNWMSCYPRCNIESSSTTETKRHAHLRAINSSRMLHSHAHNRLEGLAQLQLKGIPI